MDGHHALPHMHATVVTCCTGTPNARDVDGPSIGAPGRHVLAMVLHGEGRIRPPGTKTTINPAEDNCKKPCLAMMQ